MSTPFKSVKWRVSSVLDREKKRERKKEKTEWEEIFWGFVESPRTVKNAREKCQAASTATVVQALVLQLYKQCSWFRSSATRNSLAEESSSTAPLRSLPTWTGKFPFPEFLLRPSRSSGSGDAEFDAATKRRPSNRPRHEPLTPKKVTSLTPIDFPQEPSYIQVQIQVELSSSLGSYQNSILIT